MFYSPEDGNSFKIWPLKDLSCVEMVSDENFKPLIRYCLMLLTRNFHFLCECISVCSLNLAFCFLLCQSPEIQVSLSRLSRTSPTQSDQRVKLPFSRHAVTCLKRVLTFSCSSFVSSQGHITMLQLTWALDDAHTHKHEFLTRADARGRGISLSTFCTIVLSGFIFLLLWIRRLLCVCVAV